MNKDDMILISVDDHIVEPPDMFRNHLQKKYLDEAPRLVHNPDGSDTWQFREDLLFRLNTVEIHLPALRERREDIPPLALHFLSQYASRYRRPVKGIESTALQSLLQYAWPGNVRELEHTMERAVLMCRAEQIQTGDLGLGSQRGQSQNLEELSLEAVESILIRKALQRFQGNVSQAAEALGLSRGALYRRMEKYGL